ncbi:YoaK family protein [Streptomyces sp. ZYX-F-203]
MSEISPRDVRQTAVMGLLTVVAGAVDAISFLTMGKVFCTLATGNVLFLSFALAGAGDVPVVRPAVAIAGFLLGIVLGAYAARRLRSARRPWFVLVLAGEGALLAAAGVVALARYGVESPGDRPDGDLVGMVAFAMGVRAANALAAGVPGMPTLLSQPALASLVGDLVTRTGRDGRTSRRRLARGRWGATVGGIFLGGVLGALLLVPLGTGRALLVVAGAVLLLAALAEVFRRAETPS